jgi:RNA polymerase-binding transcription factor DksA
MNRSEAFDKLRAVLRERRDELRQTLSEGLSLLSGHDEDDDEWYDDGSTSSLVEGESEELEAIDEALQRMQDGSYGVCVTCRRDIRLERLQAVPHAATCIRCQREAEG